MQNIRREDPKILRREQEREKNLAYIPKMEEKLHWVPGEALWKL